MNNMELNNISLEQGHEISDDVVGVRRSIDSDMSDLFGEDFLWYNRGKYIDRSKKVSSELFENIVDKGKSL